MRSSVRLIEGLHITAADKRNILGCIEFMRDKDPGTWSENFMGLPRSLKSYGIAPDPEQPNRYAVVIKTKYRSDHGEPRESIQCVVIETDGVKPLPHPAYETQDLFSPNPWEVQL